MAPDLYLQHVLQTHQRSTPLGVEAATTRVAQQIALTLRSACASLLRDVSVSGSLAKGTADLGGSHLDPFLSFGPSSAPLRDLYEEVHGVAQAYGGLVVDLVPARQHVCVFGAGDHSLYVRAQRTWTKTNVATHIATVRTSDCTNEVRLLKVWRDQHRLDLTSFLLELLVIQSLKLAPMLGPWTLAERLRTLVFPSLMVVDQIGYLPISRTGAQLFFRLMSRRYEHASTVLTSNKSFAEWGDVFGDEVMAAALIARIITARSPETPRRMHASNGPLIPRSNVT